MAKRMGLKAVIEIGKERTDRGRKRKKPVDKDSRHQILNDIAEGIREAKEMMAGKKKGLTLKEVFRDED
jgi:hypothetical protein